MNPRWNDVYDLSKSVFAERPRESRWENDVLDLLEDCDEDTDRDHKLRLLRVEGAHLWDRAIDTSGVVELERMLRGIVENSANKELWDLIWEAQQYFERKDAK